MIKKIIFILFSLIIIGCDEDEHNIYGCVDSHACNFNPEATVNEGCEYTSCEDEDNSNEDSDTSDSCNSCDMTQLFKNWELVNENYTYSIECGDFTLPSNSYELTFNQNDDTFSYTSLNKSCTGRYELNENCQLDLEFNLDCSGFNIYLDEYTDSSYLDVCFENNGLQTTILIDLYQKYPGDYPEGCTALWVVDYISTFNEGQEQ